MNRIYLDYNATTPLDSRVLESMRPHLSEFFGNPSSQHEEGRKAEGALHAARAQVARRLQADEKEIVFTSGGTEANALVLYSTLRRKRPHVITTAVEHPSVLETCLELQRRGWMEVTVLPVDGDGRLDPAAVERALRPDTALISVMTANNETGALQPIAEVGKVARASGVPLHSDAVQLCGKGLVRPHDWGVDFLTLTAHKFYGPKGAGILCRRSGAPWESWMFGGGQEDGGRAGTENVAAIVGAAKAIELCNDPLEWEAIRRLRDHLWEALWERIPNLVLNTPLEHSVGNTLNVAFLGVGGDSLLLSLNLKGVAVSVGAACHTAKREPSHVLLAMGRSPAQARSSLRFSLGRWSTLEEVERVAEITAASTARLRAMAPEN